MFCGFFDFYRIYCANMFDFFTIWPRWTSKRGAGREREAGGVNDGGTDVVVIGSGFRDFGELMRCRFGTQKMSASLTAPEGEFIDATNHYQISCHSPAANSEYEQAVGVEVTLNRPRPPRT